MYRCILTILVYVALFADVHSQWEILNEGIRRNLHTIDFVDKNVGWIGGDRGLLLKTEDAGKSWNRLAGDDNWNIRYIDFLNDSLGWAIGMASNWELDREAIMKTTDGGQSWQIKKIIPDRSNNWLGALRAVDHEVAYAVVTTQVDEADILKTSDGGETWEGISPYNVDRNFHTAWFFDRDRGMVAGNTYQTVGDNGYTIALILTTRDGGTTWEEKLNIGFPTIYNLTFIDDSTGFFCNWHGWLFKTEDAFRTQPTTVLFDSTFVLDYHPTDRSTVYAIVRNWRNGTDRYHILVKSTDSGLTWGNEFPINWNLNKIYFSSSEVGFLVGTAPFNGNILRTPDAGDRWEHRLLSYPLLGVNFIDKDNGIACGGTNDVHYYTGNVFVTNDGGRTWKAIYNTVYAVNSCQFINDSVGFALSRGYREQGSTILNNETNTGFLSKTTTGGNSWITLPFNINYSNSSFTFFAGSDMYFINDTVGWAVGSASLQNNSDVPVIIKTTNGGISWELVWKYLGHEKYDVINSICMLDSANGWAVGNYGLLIDCSDGHQWEKKPKITDLPLNKVYFRDHHNGWIAGGYLNWEDFQSILFKTATGGETWEVVPDLLYLIHDFYFNDSLRGWAVGANSNGHGIIMVTTDGGENWVTQLDDLIAPLTAIHFKDGYGWAVGELGLVLRTEDGGASWIDDRNHTVYPARYQLFQNYPNPFNPSTTILYSIPQNTHVTLKVYDLLGREVKTLVDEKQPAGSYTVEFDASALASGIYFSDLNAGDFSKIIKMILLK